MRNKKCMSLPILFFVLAFCLTFFFFFTFICMACVIRLWKIWVEIYCWFIEESLFSQEIHIIDSRKGLLFSFQQNELYKKFSSFQVFKMDSLVFGLTVLGLDLSLERCSFALGLFYYYYYFNYSVFHLSHDQRSHTQLYLSRFFFYI